MLLRPFLALPLLAATLALAAAPTTLVLLPPAATTAPAPHVVLLSGDEEYRSEEALPMLAKILSQRHGFRCTVLFALDPDGTINPNNSQSLPGAEALDTADVIITSLRFRAWPDEAMRHFAAAHARGVPLIALRTSTHAFKIDAGPYASFTDFGKNILGERWVSHWGKHKSEATRAVVEPASAADPLLRGVAAVFGTTDVYEAYLPADAKILLRGLVLAGMKPTDAPATYAKKRATDKLAQPVNSPAMPVAWTRLLRSASGREQRILTTTMGAATDLEDESLRRLVVNAVYWSLDREVPARADVRVVDPYAPRTYGFRGYRTGLTPADHALGQALPAGGTLPPLPPVAPKPVAPSPALNSQPSTLNSSAPLLALNPGEHVAFIGNALADRMQHHGWLETLIHAKYPGHQLQFRNLAVTGDEVATRARSENFGAPDEWLERVGASVVLAFFGFNESFKGPAGLAQFTSDLDKFIRDTRAKNYAGPAAGAPRLVLFSPIANETLPDKNFAIPAENNRHLALYTKAMADLARDRSDIVFVDLFTPSLRLYAEAAQAGRSLTHNGLHLTEAGEAALAPVIFSALFGEPAPAGDLAKLRAAVNEKNAAWHARYRTVDGYNVYGGRSKIAYDSVRDQPKITNYQVMQEEMAQRDNFAANADRRLWSVARGDPAPPEVLPLPPVTPFGTNKPGPNPDGTYPFLSGEEAIAKMTVTPGVKVNLFASEEQFPELIKPVQMAWDTKGRLWVSVWPSYPERTPTSKTGDSIIILEDTDGDGKADKCTHFLDDLNCPTGFQFFKDGILVMQAPNLWFVRDTDGDGRGDWKERLLMGLDSADSHHTANSLIYEPGGAILLSDGVFHRTQVETALGPVRNVDGAVYRFEPLTGRFETYASYGFANPHGRSFDYWGNDLITDATGNNTYFGAAFSGRLDFPAKHPKMKTIWDRPSRPSAGSIILTSPHFPAEFAGNFLNPNVIGFQGVYRVKLVDDGSGLKGERLPDFVSSTDRNFRPIDLSVGPDGALYLLDWHNPLIGHLQSHLRDANRDHSHGRIYRFTSEGRPLAVPPKLDGQPLPALLDLLRRPENHIRNLVKIELGKRPSAEVIAAADTWLAALDPAAPDYAHHAAEILWLHQWHNIPDPALLRRQLASAAPGARAAAARVLGYWGDRVPGALPLLARAAADENPRVRLHAVRAASFFASAAAADVALAATKFPIDYYLDYVIGETLRQLRPFWRQSLADGSAVAGGDAASFRYLLRTLSVAEVLKLPRHAEVLENLLGRAGVPDAARSDALAALAKLRGVAPVDLLLATIQSPAEIDVKAVGRLLLAQSPADLRARRPALLQLALRDTYEGRAYAWAAAAVADGTLEKVLEDSASSPLSRAGLVNGLSLIPDPALRARGYDLAMPLLALRTRELPGPEAGGYGVHSAAIRAAVISHREPAKVFAALTAMIVRGDLAPVAAQGIRGLPRESWPAAEVATAATALVAWAQHERAGDRGTRDYIETIQVADALLGALPPAAAEPLRAALETLRVPVYYLRTVPEGMRYDLPRLVVPAGKPFEIVFENIDVMPHNLIVVKPGARERVGTAAMTMLPDQRDDRGRAFVPASPDIVNATRTLEPDQTETLRLPALRTEGSYEYVCTFPGHWVMMFGELVVTKNVADYLKAHPAPAARPTVALEFCDPRRAPLPTVATLLPLSP